MTRVVVADDSPFMRTQISDILDDGGLEVVARAKNGREAVDAVVEHEPDVVTMDIKMPGIGGLEAVRRIVDRQPTPILMLSGYTEEGTSPLFEALDAGAVDFFPKPGGQVSPELVRYRDLLVDTVRAVAEAGVPGESEMATTKPASVTVVEPPTLVIGASTGGPSTVESIVEELPTTPAFRVVVVIHMPPKFTARYADRLDRASEYDFGEAADGATLAPGSGVVAKGDHHLEVAEAGEGTLRLSLTNGPRRHKVRPAIDVTMESVARSVTGPVVGVVLTGMGRDGAAGIEAIASNDGHVIVENPETSAVDGMPTSAIETGVVDATLDAGRIPQRAIDLVSESPRPR